MTVDQRLKGAVLAVLAFGFLAFYAWFCFEGIALMNTCANEARKPPAPVALMEPAAKMKECTRKGAEMGNVMDLFVPISGVVTAVALSALAVRPNNGESFVRLLGFHSSEETTSKGTSWPDILVGLYLLGWVVVGLTVCFQTAYLSEATAREWKLEWLRTLGRTWWPAALTAVGIWLGVPAKSIPAVQPKQPEQSKPPQQQPKQPEPQQPQQGQPMEAVG